MSVFSIIVWYILYITNVVCYDINTVPIPVYHLKNTLQYRMTEYYCEK